MDFNEETIKSEYIYKGKVIDVRRDDVLIANGHKSVREVVEHSGGVVILALKNDKILVVKQFRYPLKTVSIELPAGKLEKNEDPFCAAKRELKEETGFVSEDWLSLGYIYTTPAICDEKLYLYLAKNLHYEGAEPDENEIIVSEEYSKDKLLLMIDEGVINDSKTICAIMRARKYL